MELRDLREHITEPAAFCRLLVEAVDTHEKGLFLQALSRYRVTRM